CEECRRRRIRCDRTRPQCLACATSGVECIVRDSCPARGPKKGYLKTLQKKIEELEGQLEKQGTSPAPTYQTMDNDSSTDNNESQNITPEATDFLHFAAEPIEFPFPEVEPWGCFDSSYTTSLLQLPLMDNVPDLVQFEKESALEISPLEISPMMQNDLDQLYFDRAYAFAPIIHAHRYRLWSKQINKTTQRTCLQYAMWTLASSLSSQFHAQGCKLYAKSRQLLEKLEAEEPCHQISLEQAQAWALLSIYELTCQDFDRGMMSAGRALRLIQMMRLYELDMPRNNTTKLDQSQRQLTQVPEDWISIETKRRTFWLGYLIDRFTSMVDGLHMFFDERMIRTRLPSPEANFASNRPTDMNFLADVVPDVSVEWPHSNLSPFAECVIGATMCGRVLQHKQNSPFRPCEEFCARHRTLNALLAQRIKMLRIHASLDYPDPIVAFVALAAQIDVLMLYDLIESRPLGTGVEATQLVQALHAEHKQQALDAVNDISMLVSVLSQHFQMHPLTPILLLLGARFSQSHPELNDAYIKLMPNILTMLQALTGLNKLAANFLEFLKPQGDPWSGFT
ncbi:hypothetical protein N7528_009762, partial [Penicillium herquei]